jgi:hypothetical protein
MNNMKWFYVAYGCALVLMAGLFVGLFVSPYYLGVDMEIAAGAGTLIFACRGASGHWPVIHGIRIWLTARHCRITDADIEQFLTGKQGKT